MVLEKVSLKKLRIILQSKILLLFFFLCFGIRFTTCMFIPKESSYQLNDTSFVGYVRDFSWEEGKLWLEITTESEILSGFSKQTLKELELNLHDQVLVKGSLEVFSERTNFYAFDYKTYANRHHQYYSIAIESVQVVQNNTNVFYQVKNFFRKRIQNFSSSSYLNAFLLGDTSSINEDVMEGYRNLGVSHLFAVSGMHVSFLMGFLAFFFKKIHLSNVIQLFFYCSFLLFYTFLVGFSPSVLRASLFFIGLKLNSIYQWNFKPVFILLFIFFFLLFINPYYLWDVGFQYSFTISFVLVLSSSFLSDQKNYMVSILATSYISFLASIVIGVVHFHQIQVFSIFYNLIFVPFVSIFLFPFSFLVFVFPFLEFLYLFFVSILEEISLFFSQLRMTLWIMRHPGVFGVIFLCLVSFFSIFLFLKKRKISILLCFSCLFLYHHISIFIPEDFLVMLDVGQGDSLVLVTGGKVMLVDTGGSIYRDISKKTIIPYLKAKGILQIDLLVFTHGDYDHVGSALSLLKNFPVKEVLFNSNQFNDHEKTIISLLEKKNIPFLKNEIRRRFAFGNFFIDTFSLDSKDENESSIILYGSGFSKSFLLMGDATVQSENEWLQVYSHIDVDILKVGHHGSKTSTGEIFLKSINPQIALISAGRKNRFGHPSSEVVNRLAHHSVFIYSTIDQGAVLIDFRKNGNISTVLP